jgi:hypothetical protein
MSNFEESHTSFISEMSKQAFVIPVKGLVAKVPEWNVEIAARFYESLAMTLKCTFCHCEELSHEAISCLAIHSKGGVQSSQSLGFSIEC